MKNAAPEHSVATMILSQFDNMTSDDKDELFGEKSKRGYENGKVIEETLSRDFEYSGKAMRALTTVSILSHST